MIAKEELRAKLLPLKKAGVNILKLSYPLTLHPLGTFADPAELALKVAEMSDEEINALIPTLKTCLIFGVQEGEIDIFKWEPMRERVKTSKELFELYRKFKEEAEQLFYRLPPSLRQKIRARGKPKLKPYVITEEMIRVFMSFAGETLSYALFLHNDERTIRRKAELLLSDLRAIIEGEFIPF